MDSARRPAEFAPFRLRLRAALIDVGVLLLVGLALGLGFASHVGGPGGTGRLLGFPIARYIDIDDSESILRAIRETAPAATTAPKVDRPVGQVWRAS